MSKTFNMTAPLLTDLNMYIILSCYVIRFYMVLGKMQMCMCCVYMHLSGDGPGCASVVSSDHEDLYSHTAQGVNS